MKIYTYYTESHKPFYDNYFSKTIEDLEVVGISGDQECPTGSYYQDGWKQTTMKKVDVFIKACEENQGKIFVYSDVDIQFFGPLKDVLIQELGDYDIAIQNDYLGGMCSGFFVCRGNERTLKMFISMKNNESQYHEDQHALNMNLHLVRYKSLSPRFWTFGIYKTQWKNQNFEIPADILMHHANWTEGIKNKTNLLNFVRQKHSLIQIVQRNKDDYQAFLYDFFKEFRPNPKYPVYPPYHQGDYLEDYFIKYFYEFKPVGDIYFIPVSWTTCYIENVNLFLLQEKLLSLDKKKNYFVVSQHDDAIRELLPPNTKKFCAGGNSNGIPIPLICSEIPNDIKNRYHKDEKDVFCSFVGSITHPIRQRMVDVLKNEKDFILKYGNWKNNVSQSDMELFFEFCGKSKFTLCPRGYGKNSFRMYECMQFGSIPVYIHDDDWRPFKHYIDWDEFSVCVHISELDRLVSILKTFDDDKVKQMSEKCVEYYESFFTLENMSKNIIQNL